MQKRRKQRLDSLLHEVIAEIIHDKIKNPKVHALTTVTHVDVSKELDVAFVYISIMVDDPLARSETLAALKESSRFIAQMAFKEVSMFQFPKLEFRLDDSILHMAKMESIFSNLEKERKDRPDSTSTEEE